jgi:hypothetical protein
MVAAPMSVVRSPQHCHTSAIFVVSVSQRAGEDADVGWPSCDQAVGWIIPSCFIQSP